MKKKRFVRHIRPYWKTHRQPATSAMLLEQLQEQGQLELIAAKIVNMQEIGEVACVTIKRRKQPETETIAVSRVINCTGPECDYRKVSVPLVQHMLAVGLIKQDGLNLRLLTSPNGTVINENGSLISGLFTLRPPRKGTAYESTALLEIRQQAKKLVHKLLQGDNYPIRAVKVA